MPPSSRHRRRAQLLQRAPVREQVDAPECRAAAAMIAATVGSAALGAGASHELADRRRIVRRPARRRRAAAPRPGTAARSTSTTSTPHGPQPVHRCGRTPPASRRRVPAARAVRRPAACRRGEAARRRRPRAVRRAGRHHRHRRVGAAARSRANTVTQSSDAHAGTTPAVDDQPRVGLSPTMPLQAAGTRPDPAVSVPSARSTQSQRDGDRRTASSTRPRSGPGRGRSRHAPYGLRVPTSPVANWSRLVLPTHDGARRPQRGDRRRRRPPARRRTPGSRRSSAARRRRCCP